MHPMTNRRVLLARRPRGMPVAEDFTLVHEPVPQAGPGRLLLRNLYLSLDPYMRGRMNDDAHGYAAPYALGAPPGGATVARVVQAGIAGYAQDELVVVPDGGWQDYVVSDGAGLRRLPAETARPSLALGILGMTGFTAWWGLTAIGEARAGETLVVSAAAGAVGSTAGQIGRLLGCRVVGIAGGPEKCRLMVEEFGFDACIDYRAPDFPARLAVAAPGGVDIYFENVGGAVRDAVWPLLNTGARVPVCGLVANYNGAACTAGARIDQMLMSLIVKRIRMQGFMNADHIDAFDSFEAQMRGWLADGRLRAAESMVRGLGQAPHAFIGLFRGDNTGKLVLQLED